jgi:hypothetical protein
MSGARLDAIFAAKWDAIDQELATMRKGGRLPVSHAELDGTTTQLSVRDVEHQLAKLKDTLFTVAVCGVVKAGKSTFLNSLLFGDAVLPVFATPMTAKLTFIRYTDEANHFEAEFYSLEEMAEMAQRLPADAQQELRQRQEQAFMLHGVRKDACLASGVNRRIRVGNLAELDQYVSVPDPAGATTETAAGKFTPYVKSVSVYIRDKNLRNIQVVDTPGLNDPNAINSKETTRWIQEAHAIVYLLTPRGVTSEDVRFFDLYFPFANPDNRIFVMNMIDQEANYRSSIDYIRELGRRKDYQMRGMFGAQEKICPYSSLVTLSRQKQAAGRALSETEAWCLEGADGLDADPMQVAGVVAQTLFAREGQLRINRGADIIKKVYEYNRVGLESELRRTSAELADCRHTADQLKRDIEQITAFAKDLANKQDRVIAELDEKLRQALDDTRSSVITTFGDINRNVDGVRSRLEGSTRAVIAAEFPWNVRDAVKTGLAAYEKDVTRPLMNEIRSILARTKLKLEVILKGNGIDSEILDCPLDTSAFGFDAIMEPAKAKLSALNGDALHGVMGFWSFRSTDLAAARARVADTLEQVQEAVHQCLRTLQDAIGVQVSAYITQIRSDADDRRTGKERALKRSEGERAQEAEKLAAQITVLREQKAGLDAAIRSMTARLDG